MKIAIIIPYYKIDFIRETLTSLENQTNQNFTVFIGNDDSPDDPIEIVKTYSNKIDLKYFHFRYNIGSNSLTNQWHRCIEKVDHVEWAMILGDDDVLDKNCISDFYLHLEEVEKRKIGVVRFASLVIDSENKPLSQINRHPIIENSVSFLFRKMCGNARSSLSEHVFRMTKLKKEGFKNFPLAWHADDLALLEMSNFGDIWTINSSFVSVRSSKINISGRKELSRIKNKGSFRFYHYLLKNHREHFSQKEMQIIYNKYQKRLIDDKRNFSMFLELSSTYLKDVKLYSYIHFLKNYLLSLLNAKRCKSRKIEI